ncbi:restriction endonuclease [Ideonella azotifigens]|uniref:Restriction endonuclease type IV Mrr domain-containing protein n=3 Tax=Ideonella azotifigens TaxID=513160 RepID=A0ABP3VX03_9BURK|nr:restriction endonuclease [Ideonella azotifigens]MCD2343360.1 restriction endonuclease [Ideonella azotifigens]
MASKHSSKRQQARSARRQQDTAIVVAGLGLLFTLLPLLLGKTAYAPTFASAAPVGWGLLALGVAGFLWLRYQHRASVSPWDGQRMGDGATRRSRKRSEGDRVEPSLFEEAGPGIGVESRHAEPPSTLPPASASVLPLKPARPPAPPPAPGAISTRNQLSPRRVAGTLPATASLVPERPTAWSVAVFEAIEWRRFEAVVEALFQQAGFETRSKSHADDDGVDLWLYSRHQPGRPVSVVQCKHWHGRRVGVDRLQALSGTMAARDVRRGQFATTSGFTPEAEAFAREHRINLLDSERLLALIAQRSPEEQQLLLTLALENDYWRPTCVSCGKKMTERARRTDGSPFWGCTGYPQCHKKMPMRLPA